MGYLLFFSLVFFIAPRRNIIKNIKPETRFVIVVPAHNEEKMIARTLASLKSIDYPEHLYRIIVIADNCSDNTVEVASAESVEVYERKSITDLGKGFALSFAIDKILQDDFAQAIVIVDADTIVSANLLMEFEYKLREGALVLQAYYGVLNPDASPLTFLFDVGNKIENLLFYAGKSKIGLSALLRGTGMCFARSVFERVKWASYSVAEDVEFAVELVKRNIPIHFVKNAFVFADQPLTLAQANSQRIRWASGNSFVTKMHALKLIKDGFVTRSMQQIDAGITLISQSRPLLLMLLAAALVFSYSLAVIGSQIAVNLTAWAVILCLIFGLYILMGIFLSGITLKRLMYLLIMPVYAVWLVSISIAGIFGFRLSKWVRTQR
ncbi:MAG: glycosyltransferase family 2 protein [Dissulfurispiraceae bacterium]|nr:glycosyltransferase family 2 protein [Dissulfurispiraceae bacterium]